MARSSNLTPWQQQGGFCAIARDVAWELLPPTWVHARLLGLSCWGRYKGSSSHGSWATGKFSCEPTRRPLSPF
ncbi:unnamed protein product [Linum tenue]|uniref:Uncharacterized protein n=1 Tax=Linum tenue TaxID=586396 RepID=A0AAV0K999_9ROSI|nr:unnamed protein product [Linum tenue]